jgi:hypothetical protein
MNMNDSTHVDFAFLSLTQIPLSCVKSGWKTPFRYAVRGTLPKTFKKPWSSQVAVEYIIEGS